MRNDLHIGMLVEQDDRSPGMYKLYTHERATEDRVTTGEAPEMLFLQEVGSWANSIKALVQRAVPCGIHVHIVIESPVAEEVKQDVKSMSEHNQQ